MAELGNTIIFGTLQIMEDGGVMIVPALQVEKDGNTNFSVDADGNVSYAGTLDGSLSAVGVAEANVDGHVIGIEAGDAEDVSDVIEFGAADSYDDPDTAPLYSIVGVTDANFNPGHFQSIAVEDQVSYYTMLRSLDADTYANNTKPATTEVVDLINDHNNGTNSHVGMLARLNGSTAYAFQVKSAWENNILGAAANIGDVNRATYIQGKLPALSTDSTLITTFGSNLYSGVIADDATDTAIMFRNFSSTSNIRMITNVSTTKDVVDWEWPVYQNGIHNIVFCDNTNRYWFTSQSDNKLRSTDGVTVVEEYTLAYERGVIDYHNATGDTANTFSIHYAHTADRPFCTKVTSLSNYGTTGVVYTDYDLTWFKNWVNSFGLSQVRIQAGNFGLRYNNLRFMIKFRASGTKIGTPWEDDWYNYEWHAENPLPQDLVVDGWDVALKDNDTIDSNYAYLSETASYEGLVDGAIMNKAQSSRFGQMWTQATDNAGFYDDLYSRSQFPAINWDHKIETIHRYPAPYAVAWTSNVIAGALGKSIAKFQNNNGTIFLNGFETTTESDPSYIGNYPFVSGQYVYSISSTGLYRITNPLDGWSY
jgi:hypothetical protein